MKNEILAEQKRVVAKHLNDGKTLTKLYAANKYGIINLGDVILHLRKRMPIDTNMQRNAEGKRWAAYKKVKK